MFIPQSGLPAWSLLEKYRCTYKEKQSLVAVMATQNSYVVTTDEVVVNPKFYAYKNDRLIGEYDTYGEALFVCEQLAKKEQ